MRSLAVVAVAYNRVNSLARLLRSLAEADYGGCEVPLIISIDHSGSDAVERYARDFHWPFGPKHVKTHDHNLGLREHILSQGREELERYDAIVVLEDDIIVSPAFYSYARQCVERYWDSDEVGGISLYSFPLSYLTHLPFEPLKDAHDVFFMQIAQSWGEVWMRPHWRRFYAWYERNLDFAPSEEVPAAMFGWTRSWLKYHTRWCIETGRWFVYPYYAMSSNCGDVGSHTGDRGGSAIFQTSLPAAIGALRLPEHPDEGVRYDAFMENVGLHRIPGLEADRCRLDIAGVRGPAKDLRYCLSSRPLPYAVVRSWGMSRRPVEANVIHDEPGDAIRLYDTHTPAPAPTAPSWPAAMILYRYRIQDFLALARRVGLKTLRTEAMAGLRRRLGRKG